MLSHADPLAESPPESRLRVHLVLAGLPRPVCQLELRDGSGLVIYRLDLGWPELLCAAEFDGAQHREDEQQYH